MSRDPQISNQARREAYNREAMKRIEAYKATQANDWVASSPPKPYVALAQVELPSKSGPPRKAIPADTQGVGQTPTRPKAAVVPVLDETITQALVQVRQELDRFSQRYPTMHLEFLLVDERCSVSEAHRRETLAVHRKLWNEEHDPWVQSKDAKWCARFINNIGGAEEIVRLEQIVTLLLAPFKICTMELLYYLSVCRPSLFLEADIAFDLQPARELPKVRHLSLKHPAFHSLRAVLDWLLNPTRASLIPATAAEPIAMLPNWKGLGDFVARMEGTAPKSRAISRPVVGNFFVEYRGRRCDFGPGKHFQLFERLSRCWGHYFTYPELRTEIWGRDSMIEDVTVRKAASMARTMLRQAQIDGIEIIGRMHMYALRLS
jgi:hypothetical protein